MSETRPDVVVVGAGSAGCVVAARLSEDPARRVLVLEAGPDDGGPDGPAGLSGASFFDALAVPGRSWPGLDVVRTAAQGPRLYARGRGVGGSSSVNAMVAIPGLAADYDRWEQLGATGWNWASLGPWFGRTALTLTPASDAEFGPIGRALTAAWPDRVERVPLTRDARGLRVSAADAYLGPARDRANIEVRGDRLVDRVLIDQGRVLGVRLADGTEIEAGSVVVAAGAIHSPAILLRSGIDRPGIGRHLRDHASVPIAFRYHDGLAPSPGSLAVGALARWSSGGAADDLQLLPLEHLGRDAPGLGMTMVALMHVESEGEVMLSGPDVGAEPHVEFRMLSTETDRRRLRIGAEQTLELLDHPAFRSLGAVIEPDLSEEGLVAGLGDYVHAAGTCRMGSADDPGAVVDPQGEVIGVDGLYVCDASVFPDLPRANTHLPVVAVAERLSALWRARGPESDRTTRS